MKIKEVEELLGITRANIRYYEKEGLFSVERKGNKYREYTEKDISVLKKIIVLRKLSVTIEDIRALFKNEKSLASVLDTSIERLHTELGGLKGALVIAKRMEYEGQEEFDEDLYFDLISNEEKKGNKFIDLCKDMGRIELDIIDDFTKHFLFYDFKKHRQNAGMKVAVIMLLGFLMLFGLGGDGFIDTVKFPLMVLIVVSVVCFPIMLVKTKLPKVADICSKIMIWSAVIAMILFAVALIVTATLSLI